MSYNMINQKTKDGLDGTKYVTQLHVVPGPKMEDKLFKTFDDDIKIHPSTISSPSASLINVANHKKSPKISTTNLESCKTHTSPTYFEAVNSAASDIRKAIEKAQESIRIAKESLGRKTKGLGSFSNKKFKVEGNMEDVTATTSTQNFPSFMDGKKLVVAKKIVDKMNEKILESTNKCTVPVMDETKSVPHDSDAVDTQTTKTEILNFVHEDQTCMFADDYVGKVEVVKTTTEVLEHQNVEEEQETVERVEVDKLRESKKNADEVRLSNAHESVKEANNLNVSQKMEDENEKRLNVENDKGITEEVFEWLENENESKDEHNSKVHQEEGISEMFCERETDVNLPDDNEIKQEDYNLTCERKGQSLDESCDQESDEKSAGDDNVSTETEGIDGIYGASNNVDMNENIVERTHCHQMQKEELFEKTSMDQIASYDNDDECEVTSQENCVLSESSFGTTHCVKTEADESNKQKNIIDHLADLSSDNVQAESSSCTAHEIKDSQEPQYSDKEGETEEPGPSKVAGQDHFRRIYEAAAAKERERVKSRSAVEMAICEARNRASEEACERAVRQRAAVENAIEEVRQRMMAEDREKVAKASVVKKSSSVQSKLRAERAAVERSTSEARQRALEKATSQKSVSDLNRTESALRTKAKLEKHNRIMERAANMLAEKEKRGRLAQKEKTERNHLAQNLDADIRKWSNGKEGNLHALLSTLQYILGPESGWQPVSLAHIITTSDVKKAYRKATLCVHPDKLQGASIQHKYICEKVFDLLKVAWKRFDYEERWTPHDLK